VVGVRGFRKRPTKGKAKTGNQDKGDIIMRGKVNLNRNKNTGHFMGMTLKAILMMPGFCSAASTAYWVVALDNVILWASPVVARKPRPPD
jgi:hypothetical protein